MSSAGRFRIEEYGVGLRLVQQPGAYRTNDPPETMDLDPSELSDLIYVARKAMEAENAVRRSRGMAELEKL
jgi:hypothetical protein